MTTEEPPPDTETADAALLASTVERLRAEQEATEDGTAKAILLHEIGVIEELLGDEASAARDHLGAVNLEPQFREPLERLIVIIERRKSFKNLGRLLERLDQVADSPVEKARAQFLTALYCAEHEEDLDAARDALQTAVEETRDDAVIWLHMEIIAGKLGDDALRLQSLAERARVAAHPSWRALLLIDVAGLHAARSEFDEAMTALEQAIDTKADATFLALRALEQLGYTAQRDEWVAKSLEAQAALLLKATETAEIGEQLGVPRYRRSTAYVTDAWLRAADAHRRNGDAAKAATLLDQALTHVPDAPQLLHARLAIAEVTGDTATAARLAKLELDHGLEGGVAASLWMRVAEAAAAEGNPAEALAATRSALEQDPASLPARTLQLDLLAATEDAQGLAAALEEVAEQFPSDEAKGRAYLLAADTWARLARDSQGAKAALSQAGMYGVSRPTVARVGRMLAAIVGDHAWYEENTRRLLAGAEPELAGELWFELARARLGRGDAARGSQALQDLAKLPGYAWLGNMLGAYATDLKAPVEPEALPGATPSTRPPPQPVDPSTSLKALADAEPDAAQARSLRTIMAARALLSGERETAIAELRKQHDEAPDDVTVALALADALDAGGDPHAAADGLAQCAAHLSDAESAAALFIEAGVRHWRGGERERATELFEEAAQQHPPSGNVMLSWALRAAQPNDPTARARSLDAAADTGDTSALLALERFGLDAGAGQDLDVGLGALAGVEDDSSTAGAVALARMLGGAADAEAYAQLSTLGANASALSASAHFYQRLAGTQQPDSVEIGELAELASVWAARDRSLTAALEWLAFSTAKRAPMDEINARRMLAESLTGDAAEQVRASAAQISLLQDLPTPLLTGDAEATRLMNLDIAPPGCDPRKRAAALSNVGDALTAESESIVTACAGWNQLVAMDVGGALESFRSVTEAHPEEALGWEGLRAAAEAAGERATVAEACAALGDAVADDQRGAELWEQAGLILQDEFSDAERAEYAYSRATERDITRPIAFDRVFRLVRARKDGTRLLALIEARLEVAEDPDEIVKMFWERARVLRAAGDTEGALAALENVTMLEPDHVGALALAGEIALKAGHFEDAAANLAKLAELDAAPRQQRLLSGVAAVDIYENKLDRIDDALTVLIGLDAAGLSTLPVRERLAKVATKAQEWEQATQSLEQLMHERETPDQCATAARLAMVIHRDKRQGTADGVAAAQRLLALKPGDGEAIDFVLTDGFPQDARNGLLQSARATLVQTLAADPLDAETIDRLARTAGALGDAAQRQATLGALVALGHGNPRIDAELRTLDERVAHLPQIAIDADSLPQLADPEDVGPIGAMMRSLAPVYCAAIGPGLAAFGVGKKERVNPKQGLPIRNEVAAWAGALGIGDFDVYIGGRDSGGIYAIPSERPAIVIGPSVAVPLTVASRQELARELFALRRGTTLLRHRDPTDIAALVAATFKVAGLQFDAPSYAMLGEFERQLAKEMPRKVKKTLAQLAEPVLRSGQNTQAWVAAATSSLDRLAAVAAGDVSYVLASSSGGQRGQPGASNAAIARTKRLLRFVLSPTYLALRAQLGMGVK